MAGMLAENVSDKDVMGVDGTELGSLYNITMDLKTGELQELVVDPREGVSRRGYDVDEYGRFHVPVEKVQDVKDYIVVAR